MRQHRDRKAAAAALMGLVFCVAGVAPSFAAQAPSGTAVAIPDFTGTWRLLTSSSAPANARLPPGGPGMGPPPNLMATLPLLRPEVAARIMAAGRERPPPGAPVQQDRGYCMPQALAGPMGFVLVPAASMPVRFEILASPGRLTMLDETSLIRRLYLQDKLPPDVLDESNSGNSIAKMEGSTLVVQTTGLNPSARTILGIPGSELGPNAHLLERMTLVAPGQLEIVTTVTAPALYAAPVTSTNRFRREPGPPIEMAICVENDRSFDHATKRERFEATPPADLPPPPAG